MKTVQTNQATVKTSKTATPRLVSASQLRDVKGGYIGEPGQTKPITFKPPK